MNRPNTRTFLFALSIALMSGAATAAPNVLPMLAAKAEGAAQQAGEVLGNALFQVWHLRRQATGPALSTVRHENVVGSAAAQASQATERDGWHEALNAAGDAVGSQLFAAHFAIRDAKRRAAEAIGHALFVVYFAARDAGLNSGSPAARSPTESEPKSPRSIGAGAVPSYLLR